MSWSICHLCRILLRTPRVPWYAANVYRRIDRLRLFPFYEASSLRRAPGKTMGLYPGFVSHSYYIVSIINESLPYFNLTPKEKPPTEPWAADKQKLIISWRTAERDGRLWDRIAAIVTAVNPCAARFSRFHRSGWPIGWPMHIPTNCDKCRQTFFLILSQQFRIIIHDKVFPIVYID